MRLPPFGPGSRRPDYVYEDSCRVTVAEFLLTPRRNGLTRLEFRGLSDNRGYDATLQLGYAATRTRSYRSPV
jgi:hypothetical protein